MPVMKRLTVDGVNYDTVGEASVTQVQTSGTKIATVTIDGTATDLYAPEGGGGGPEPSSTTPSMDGTAAVGTATTYARADHVHPTDTSRQAALVSGTNIKTINNQSLLGSGNISISSGGGSSWTDISSLAWVQSLADAAIIQAKTDGFLVVFCAMVSGLGIGNYPLTIFTPSGYEPASLSMAPFTASDSAASGPLGYATAFPEGAISVDITETEAYDPDTPFTFTLIYPIA